MREANGGAVIPSGWVDVGGDVASRHPLHGMRGWLRFFSLWMALSLIGGIVLGIGDVQMLASPQHRLGDTRSIADGAFGIAISLVQLVMAVQWFRVWPRFRVAFLVVVLAMAVASIGLDLWAWQEVQSLPAGGQREGAEAELADQVASDVLGIAVFVGFLLYMQRSRRFRVTFEYRVRSDDPLLTEAR